MLNQIGLDYLSLGRRADTISGGEAQRIRLATQISSGLMGMIYILDEPSIGLHARDSKKVINILNQLRDIGNTVIVVEHDLEIIESADNIVEIGPGPGIHGGEIIEVGCIDKIKKKLSILLPEDIFVVKRRYVFLKTDVIIMVKKS